MNGSVDFAQALGTLQPITQKVTLKSQLTKLLSARDMKPVELSRKSGVSKQVISLWLSGAKPKNVEQVKAVADALSVTVDLLLFGDGIETENKQAAALDALMGDEWITGAFEIKIRRLKGVKK